MGLTRHVACRGTDKPFDVAEMFSQMTTNGRMASIGGGQNDAPKGPPFNKDVSLVTLYGDLWLVVESPGQDLRCLHIMHRLNAFYIRS
jgi:hypothetical protein